MLALSLIFVATMIGLSLQWSKDKFGDITYEQILFHMNISLASETRLFKSFLQNTLMVALIVIILLYVLFGLRHYRIKLWDKLAAKVKKHALRLAMVYAFGVLALVAYRLDLPEIIQDYQMREITSSFYEENWIEPKPEKVAFPKQKRNLVLIFAESFEATFVADKNRAFFKDDFMPQTRQLAKENINFSADKDIGGMIGVNNTQWTQAGLVSQTCGIPLSLPIANHNKFLPKHGYLPAAYCLFDLLKDNDYNQVFLTGMEKNYAGVDRFFETHGQVRILDWDYFKKKYNLDEETDAFRSKIVRDDKLLEEARAELLDISKQGKPFSFTLMTMDTHGGTEFLDTKNCKAEYQEHYKNVYKCADTKVASFVRWIQQQEFYKDTMIVVVGDHLVMNDDIFEEAPNMERRVLNIFINSTVKPEREKYRKFSPLDMYPTIVEGLGAAIHGRRLALGASVFGYTPTLIEYDYTPEILEDELSKRSKIYEHILYGK